MPSNATMPRHEVSPVPAGQPSPSPLLSRLRQPPGVRLRRVRAELPGHARFCLQCGQAVATFTAARTGYPRPETYTPRHLAEKILTSKAALEGERKQVTVLFADLKGSMELLRGPRPGRGAEDHRSGPRADDGSRPPLRGHRQPGAWATASWRSSARRSLTRTTPTRACYAALRMQNAVAQYTEDIRKRHGVDVQIRVGLNSGDVVVRSIGSDLHMDYTAVGQTTHLAARMEQLARPGTTLITESTLRGPRVRPSEAARAHADQGSGRARARLRGRGRRRRPARACRPRWRGGSPASSVATRRSISSARRSSRPAAGGARSWRWWASPASASRACSTSSSTRIGPRAGSCSSRARSRTARRRRGCPRPTCLKSYFKIAEHDDVRAVRAKVTGNVLTLDEGLKDSVPPLLWVLDALPKDHELMGLEPAVRRARTLEAVKRVLLREAARSRWSWFSRISTGSTPRPRGCWMPSSRACRPRPSCSR